MTRNSLPKSLFRLVLVFAVSCVGAACAEDSHTQPCEVELLQGIDRVTLAAASSANEGEYFDRVSSLQRVIDDCELPAGGITSPFGRQISVAEIYLAAHLDEEMFASFRNLFEKAKKNDALNSQVISTMFYAMHFREFDVVHKMAEILNDLNRTDSFGNNLYFGAIGSRLDAGKKICYLWEQGVDPFIPNQSGISVIDAAVDQERLDSLRILVSLLSQSDPRVDVLLSSAKKWASAASSEIRFVVENWRDVGSQEYCGQLN